MTGIKGFIFDLDHTLYHLAESAKGHFVEAAIKSVVEVAQAQGIDFTIEQAKAKIKNSGSWHGSELYNVIQELGLVELDVFKAYHIHAFELIRPSIEAAKDSFSTKMLRDYKDNVVIVTHGSRYWCESTIKALGLEDIFPPAKMLALDDEVIGLIPKHASALPFAEALKLLGLPANQVAMVEDTSKNLIIPKQLGMKTILIKWDDTIAKTDHPHVDEFHRTVGEFLQSLPPVVKAAPPRNNNVPRAPAP